MTSFQHLTFEQQQQLLIEADPDITSTGSRVASVADLTLIKPYEGPRDEYGRFHGRGGKMVMKGNVTYMGDFLHGRKHGVGTQTWPDGTLFCGEWVHGEAVGFGKLRFPSGGEYFGQVKQGIRDGMGIFRAADGSRYFGSWKNGKRNGFGIEIGEDGTYIGEWECNVHHGWGTMQFGASLNRYTGEWQRDGMHGVGSMVWVSLKDQNRARALWRRASSKMLLNLAAERQNNIPNANANARRSSVSALGLGSRRPSLSGAGIVSAQSLMLSSDDMQQYVGEWKNGCPDGNGELRRILLSHNNNNNNNNNDADKKNKNHRTVPFEMGNHFQGCFKNGKRDGFGIQYFADGGAFEGTWNRNLKHGKGTIIRPDGTLVHVTLKNDTIVSEKLASQHEAEDEQQLMNVMKQVSKEFSESSTNLNSTQKSIQQQEKDENNQSNNNNNNNNSTVSPHSHVDVAVADICFSKNDERAVHITISLVFVSLRHLFHVYVGMQSGCGNFDDIYCARSHSKLPEGIKKRATIKPPSFVSAMSDEVMKATPIHHLSDFDGIVRLAEAHCESTLHLAASAAQKAMKTTMIFDGFWSKIEQQRKVIEAEQKKKQREEEMRRKELELLSREKAHHHNDNESDGSVTPPRNILSPPHETISPVLTSQHHPRTNNSTSPPNRHRSASPSNEDIMEKFLTWTNSDAEGLLDTLNELDDGGDNDAADADVVDVNAKKKSKEGNGAGAAGSSSIEELFGQYDGAGNAASVSGTNKATSSAERRPLATVLHLAGFLSLLRDAEVLSPDMTGQDVLDALEPLLKRRAHIPGAPGLTWPAFVEAIVRVAHKKLALSALFCAQDQLAKATLGARLQHFVKEYMYPLLRCIKDLEACPEASSIIGVEQLEIATSENTTFDSLRKATLRQLRSMTTTKENNTTIATATTSTLKRNQQSTLPGANNDNNNNNQFQTSESAVFFEAASLAAKDENNENNNSGASTPRSVSDSSVFKLGAINQNQSSAASSTAVNTTSGLSNTSIHYLQQQLLLQQQQSQLPTSFDDALALLSKQVDETLVQTKQKLEQVRSLRTIGKKSSSSAGTGTDTSVVNSPLLPVTSTNTNSNNIVTKGVELLQSLCGGSWSQFPSVSQCEVVEKILISNNNNNNMNEPTTPLASSSSSSSDVMEVWCVVSRPRRHAPEIRLHLLLVQMVRQTAEVRFVGFVPSSVLERLSVQSRKDPYFFKTVTKRAFLFSQQQSLMVSQSSKHDESVVSRQHVRKASSANSNLGPPRLSTVSAFTSVSKRANSIVSVITTSNNNKSCNTTQESANNNFSFTTTSPTTINNVAVTASSYKSFYSQHEISLSSFIAASASHQLIRGSRFFSTSALVHFDALTELYHSCGQSLGPLVSACTFSGMFGYKNNKNNKMRVTSLDVLRHCVHALYGIDPVTSPGGLFTDLKSGYSGFLSSGRNPNTGTSNSKKSTSSSNSNGTTNEIPSSSTSQNNSSLLISPDEAANAVLVALQSLAKTSRTYHLMGGDGKKFSEIAEAAKAKAVQAIKAEEQRLMYHGDNWRARKGAQESSSNITNKSINSNSNNPLSFAEQGVNQQADTNQNSDHSDNNNNNNNNNQWALAAMDLKLSFGEFVECIMIVCGLTSSASSSSSSLTAGNADSLENFGNILALSAKNNKKTLDSEISGGLTPDSSGITVKNINKNNSSSMIIPGIGNTSLSSQKNLSSTMPPATPTAAIEFLTEDLAEQQQQLQEDEQIINQALRGVMRAATSSIGKRFVADSSFKTVICSGFVLEDFLSNTLPIIHHFVVIRNALPTMVPSYWAWAIADAYKPRNINNHNNNNLSCFDHLRANFVQSSQRETRSRACSASVLPSSSSSFLKNQRTNNNQKSLDNPNDFSTKNLFSQSNISVVNNNNNSSMMARPLSPSSLTSPAKSRRSNNKPTKASHSFAFAVPDETQAKSTTLVSFGENQTQVGSSRSNAPKFTSKETIEGQRKRDKKNTTAIISSQRISWTDEDLALLQSSAANFGHHIRGIDEVKVAEILLAQELRKDQEANLVEKLQIFQNKRYNEMVTKQRAEEEARVRQEFLNSPKGSRSALLSAARKRSGSPTANHNNNNTASPSARSTSPSPANHANNNNNNNKDVELEKKKRLQQLMDNNPALSPGKKKPKGYEPPHMALVTKKITLGTRVEDNGGSRVLSLVKNELKIIKQEGHENGRKKLQPQNSKKSDLVYDDRLNRHVPGPSGFVEVVKKGFLLEAPPVSFTIRRIEEEEKKIVIADLNGSSRGIGSGRKGSTPSKGTTGKRNSSASNRKNSVSPTRK